MNKLKIFDDHNVKVYVENDEDDDCSFKNKIKVNVTVVEEESVSNDAEKNLRRMKNVIVKLDKLSDADIIKWTTGTKSSKCNSDDVNKTAKVSITKKTRATNSDDSASIKRRLRATSTTDKGKSPRHS